MTWTLLLSLLACPRDRPEDTGVQDTGAGETGETGETGEIDPDCTLNSLWPLTTSWSGGETVTLGLDCADAEDLEQMQVFVDGKEMESWATQDGVAFNTNPQSTFGLSSVTISVRSRAVGGGSLRFRVNPEQVNTVVDSQRSTPVSDNISEVLGASEQAQMLFWREAGQLQLSSTDGGSLESQELGLEVEDVIVDNGTFSGRFGAGVPTWTTQDKGGTTEAILLPTLDVTGQQLVLALGTQGAEGFSVQSIPLPFASIEQHDIDPGQAAEQAPVLYDVDMEIDQSGALLSLSVVIGLNNSKEKASAVLASYSYSKGGWVRNWQYGMTRPVAYVGPIQSADGQSGHVVVAKEDSGGDDKGGMPLLLLNQDGEISIQGKLSGTGDEPTVVGAAAPPIQGKTGGVILIAHDGEGNMSDHLVQTDTFKSVTVDEGTLGSVAELESMELRTSSDGGLHLYLRKGRSGRPGLQSPSVLSEWTWSLEKGFDLSQEPSVQVLAVGGETRVAGSPNDPVSSAPSVWLDMDGGRWLGEGELHLCAMDDWSLRTQGGRAIATLPDGKDMDLAIDPSAPLSCVLMQDTLVVLGTVDGESGLVTVNTGASGQATFKELPKNRWTHVAVSHDSRTLSVDGESVGVLGESLSEDGEWGAVHGHPEPGAAARSWGEHRAGSGSEHLGQQRPERRGARRTLLLAPAEQHPAARALRGQAGRTRRRSVGLGLGQPAHG